MKKMMMVVIVLILASIIFSQVEIPMLEPGSDYLKEYYKDVYLPKLKITKDSGEQLKLDYIGLVEGKVIDMYKKQNGIKKIPEQFNYNNFISTKRIEQDLINKRVNIKHYNEFEDIGIDFFSAILPQFEPNAKYDETSIATEYFNAALIFTATVIDSIHTTKKVKRRISGIEKEVTYHYANYKLIINYIIKGGYLFDELPKTITFYNEYGLDTFIKDKETYNQKGEIILTSDFRILNDSNVRQGEVVLILLPFNERKLKIEELLSGNLNLWGTNFFNTETINKFKTSDYFNNDLNKIINFMIKLEKINDTPNFYNRSYK